MKYLTLSIPGYTVSAPGGIPDSGLNNAGNSIIHVGLGLMIILAWILAFLYLVYGGFKWMTSGGDKEKLSAARQTMVYAILGLFVSFLAIGIIQVIGRFIGINLLTF